MGLSFTYNSLIIGHIINGFYGITVTFVKPDGTKDTFTPTDATGAYAAGETRVTGALFFYYTPDMAGNWSVSFTMPAQNITDSMEPYNMQDALATHPPLLFRLV